ncbi:transaldolase [Allocatelliglobosispora scoriae]|uniref:Transaldolase n=1 Tax=Allocatelliglobosispora scoriae TaxID=643052 RepID=A0A841BJ90_9ACTN|nr:transaldolase [Allocatelliglobosispora scoriae]
MTTNATILRRAGELAVGVAVKNILAHEPDELHVQVISEDDGQAFDQAVQLAELDSRIRVKIPFVTSQGRYRAALIRRAIAVGIPVNVTACTSLPQAFTALSLGPAFVSILWCRTRDAGEDPAQAVADIARRRDRFSGDTRLVIGSIRECDDVTLALRSPADIVTVPPQILETWMQAPGSVAMASQFALDAAELTL